MIFSDTEFYYAAPSQINESSIILDNEEAKHLVQVMRHSVGDIVFVTDGIGNIFESKINLISKNSIILEILKTHIVNEKFSNITIFIPLLKSSDRMETALEKCVELGFTKFVFFSAEKSPKKGIKINRLEKIALAAMKQSLQSNKPTIVNRGLGELTKQVNVQNILLDQLAEKNIKELKKEYILNTPINLFFGPEAGLTQKDISKIANPLKVYLTSHRLRAETAIITAASIIAVTCSN